MRDLPNNGYVTRFFTDRRVDALSRIEVFEEGTCPERIPAREQLDGIQREHMFTEPA